MDKERLDSGFRKVEMLSIYLPHEPGNHFEGQKKSLDRHLSNMSVPYKIRQPFREQVSWERREHINGH